MKREFIDPSTTTEADRALRLRKDLADAQAKLRGAEQWREQAAKAARLEREAATLRERVAELEGQVQRLRERPTLARLQRAETLAAEAERFRAKAGRVDVLEKSLSEAEERLSEMEARLKARPASTPRHVERCAQAKLNRRLFAENERLKQEARDGL